MAGLGVGSPLHWAGLKYQNAVQESLMANYWGAQGLGTNVSGIAAAVPETQTFAGSDVTVIFMIPIGERVVRPSVNANTYLESKDLQTITISSTSSLLPVRRIGEKKAISYTTGARTFAGSMIFTVINKDPFMELFGLDVLNQSATNDGSWHIDTMPPLDCAIIAQNETGGMAIQVIHGIRFTNWGTTYSIDDMYVESSYTYIAEHVTPFVINTFDAARLWGAIAQSIVGSDGVVKRGVSEDRAAQYLNLWRTANQADLAKYKIQKLPNPGPLDAITGGENKDWPGLVRGTQLIRDKLTQTLMSVGITPGVATMLAMPSSLLTKSLAGNFSKVYTPYGIIDNMNWTSTY